MPIRPDVSDSVIHFTKGETLERALRTLLTIVGEERIIGGTGMIRGGYRCVCFTEAPVPAVSGGLVNADSFTRYSPFGLMFSKRWIFDRGGRPVIYQAAGDYERLHEDLRWRHVRYDLAADPPVDFTWEREWRVRADELRFSSGDVALVVPDKEWEEFVVGIWDSQQQLEAEAYSLVLDHLLVEQMEVPCPWRVVRLVA